MDAGIGQLRPKQCDRGNEWEEDEREWVKRGRQRASSSRVKRLKLYPNP